jgi:hypothetical protein
MHEVYIRSIHPRLGTSSGVEALSDVSFVLLLSSKLSRHIRCAYKNVLLININSYTIITCLLQAFYFLLELYAKLIMWLESVYRILTVPSTYVYNLDLYVLLFSFYLRHILYLYVLLYSCYKRMGKAHGWHMTE